MQEEINFLQRMLEKTERSLRYAKSRRFAREDEIRNLEHKKKMTANILAYLHGDNPGGFVPVVYCLECKYRGEFLAVDGWACYCNNCENGLRDIMYPDTDFCPYGEREDENNGV